MLKRLKKGFWSEESTNAIAKLEQYMKGTSQPATKVYHTQEAIDHVAHEQAMQQLQAVAYKASAFGNVSGIALSPLGEVSQLVLSLPDEKLGVWAQEHLKEAERVWKVLDNTEHKETYKEARDKLGAALCWNEIQKLDHKEPYTGKVLSIEVAEGFKEPKLVLPPGTDPKIAAALDVLNEYAPGLYPPPHVVNAVLTLPTDVLKEWLASAETSAVLAVLDDTKGPEAATARHKIVGACKCSWPNLMKNAHQPIQLEEATKPLTAAEVTEKVMQAAGHVLAMDNSKLLDWITKNPPEAYSILKKLKEVPTALTGKAVNKIEKLTASLQLKKPLKGQQSEGIELLEIFADRLAENGDAPTQAEVANTVLYLHDVNLVQWVDSHVTEAQILVDYLKDGTKTFKGPISQALKKLDAVLATSLDIAADPSTELTKKANAAIFKELREDLKLKFQAEANNIMKALKDAEKKAQTDGGASMTQALDKAGKKLDALAKKAKAAQAEGKLDGPPMEEPVAKDAKELAKKIDLMMKGTGKLVSSETILDAVMLIPSGIETTPIHGEKQIEYKVLKSKESKAKVDELMKLVDSGAISFEEAKELAALSKEPVEPALTFQHNAALASQCPVANDWKIKPLSSYSDEHQDEYDPGEALPHLVKHDSELKAAWKEAAEVGAKSILAAEDEEILKVLQSAEDE